VWCSGRSYQRLRSSHRVRARVLSDNHHFAMASIPQELIDVIIDKVPHSSLPSCSLVAKRWRRKSQKRILSTILLPSEDEVGRWCTDISQDSDGISSYICHIRIEDISSWDEPALLGRMLGSLSSLTTLSMHTTEIPDDFPDYASCGDFGKRITALHLYFPDCAFGTMISMILSLPNLKELCIEDYGGTPEEPLPTYSVTPEREPLNSLKLYGNADGIGEALAKFRFTSTRLYLDAGAGDVEQLLLLSSKVVVELKLCGAWFLQILRPSRDDNDRSSRLFSRWGSPSHPSTIVTRPYHTGYRPLCV